MNVTSLNHLSLELTLSGRRGSATFLPPLVWVSDRKAVAAKMVEIPTGSSREDGDISKSINGVWCRNINLLVEGLGVNELTRYDSRYAGQNLTGAVMPWSAKNRLSLERKLFGRGGSPDHLSNLLSRWLDKISANVDKRDIVTGTAQYRLSLERMLFGRGHCPDHLSNLSNLWVVKVKGADKKRFYAMTVSQNRLSLERMLFGRGDCPDHFSNPLSRWLVKVKDTGIKRHIATKVSQYRLSLERMLFGRGDNPDRFSPALSRWARKAKAANVSGVNGKNYSGSMSLYDSTTDIVDAGGSEPGCSAYCNAGVF